MQRQSFILLRLKKSERRANLTQGYIEKSIGAENADLEKINQFTRSQFGTDELYIFSVILCNNDIDRDYERFSLNALKALKDLFVGKTGIFDHSMKAANQKARIFETELEEVHDKKTADGMSFYQLRAKAYMVRSDENKSLITEIEAGIKKEVSISCSAKSSTCSICGNDKKHGICEHVNGKTYGDKLAFSVLDDISDAYEFSFVAVPAQREAGVTKHFNIEGENTDMTSIIKSLKECDDKILLTKAQADSLISEFEELNVEAELGREYKSSLIKEVIALCSKAMPDMDINTFGSVAQIMTAKELLAFRKAFKKSADSAVCLQFKTEKATTGVNQFKI